MSAPVPILSFKFLASVKASSVSSGLQCLRTSILERYSANGCLCRSMIHRREVGVFGYFLRMIEDVIRLHRTLIILITSVEQTGPRAKIAAYLQLVEPEVAEQLV